MVSRSTVPLSSLAVTSSGNGSMAASLSSSLHSRSRRFLAAVLDFSALQRNVMASEFIQLSPSILVLITSNWLKPHILHKILGHGKVIINGHWAIMVQKCLNYSRFYRTVYKNAIHNLYDTQPFDFSPTFPEVARGLELTHYMNVIIHLSA